MATHHALMLRRQALLAWAAWLALPSAPARAAADMPATPRHLALARELVANIRPEDNQYLLGGQVIGLPGDTPGGRYTVKADCSGFLLALFKRAGYNTATRMAFLPDGRKKRTRPAAEDFVYSIEQQRGFTRLRLVRDIQPGDLLAHAMLEVGDKAQTGTTGHVFLVDSAPRPVQAREPLVAGTQQWELGVMDANDEFLGTDDTRLAHPPHKTHGLGRGTIRLYVNAQGELVGWARTFHKPSKFFSYDPRFPSDTKLRKAAMGRPLNP